MTVLVRRQLARGELPFLHVMADNVEAHRLYLGMGFVDHQESAIRIICYEGA
jgi:predicted GNAT family acetyltransferase